MSPADPRAYPDRPFLAVSAAIVRNGRVLVVRRARDPGRGLYSLPGGVVEAGETLAEAIVREVEEETGLNIKPMALAGHREAIIRDKAHRVERHFVILTFACRWVRGKPRPSEEVDEALWIKPDDLQGLNTTKGLADIIAAAMKLLGEQG